MSWRDSLPDEFGRVVTRVDSVVNPTDLTFAVPSDREWLVEAVYVELFANSVRAGNRQVYLELLVSGVAVFSVPARVVQAVGTTRRYVFCGVGRERAAFSGSVLLQCFPAWSVFSQVGVVRVYAEPWPDFDTFNFVRVVAQEWLYRM